MNISELALLLRMEGFRDSAYSLTGDNPDEALCIRCEKDQWCVFYAERGLQTGKIFFRSEKEACEYFLEEMNSDPTTRKDWKSGFSHTRGSNEKA